MLLSSENKPGDHLEFIFIGEHPAIDFANTRVVAHGNPQELFRSWSDVLDWLARTGLIKGKRTELPEFARAGALKSMIKFRRDWEKVLSELVAGGKVSAAFLKRLNALLAFEASHEIVRWQGKNGFRVERSSSRLRGEKLALNLIAHQIADFLAAAHLSYLHRCANTASCVLYFYDTTKNHRRQWCSAATCGNRNKVAQFRKRQVQAGK